MIILSSMMAEQGSKLSATDISQRTNLPEPTVAKILKTLTAHDILSSTRGAAGGYSLAMPPQDLSIINIIQAMEGPIALVSCLDKTDKSCILQSSCTVQTKWQPVNDAIIQALSGVTILDMVAEPPNKRGTA